MSRLVPVLAALLLACAACSRSEPEKAPDAAPAAENKQLAVGSPAPPLKVDRWVKGDPVPAFEPGKVYVVEFWATWCGPCLSVMPHLSDLAAQYRPQGLTVVAVTTVDTRGNTPAAVEKFAAGRGKDLNYVFAVCEKPDTYRAYMEAAGLTGIPATFVVDRAGAVAYIGRPDDLDEVLPKVLAGTWKGAPDALALRQQEAEADNILGKVQQAGELAQMGVSRSPDRAAATAAVNKAVAKAAEGVVGDLDAYAAKYPGRAATPTFRLNRAQVLMIAGRHDEARKLAEPVLTAAAKRKGVDLLRVIVLQWTNPGLNPNRRSPELATRAADEWLSIEGETNVGALMGAAQAYLFAGEKEKGRGYGEKAVGLTEDPRQRAAMERALKQFEG